MRLIRLAVSEPLPGQVMPEMAAMVGPDEAAKRYRAIVVTSLRQLRWLSGSRLRIEVTPHDAYDAVKFWLLPALAPAWQQQGTFYQADGWQIDFGGEGDESFVLDARANVLCPLLSARWIQAGLVGFGESVHEVIGRSVCSREYFSAISVLVNHGTSARVLPPLSIIRDDRDWLEALDGPLGPMLKRALEESV